jgi:hypothetical protein
MFLLQDKPGVCIIRATPSHLSDGPAWRIMKMNEYEVTCVSKPNRFSTHEHITHIGNPAAGWKITRELAIQKIVQVDRLSIR